MEKHQASTAGIEMFFFKIFPLCLGLVGAGLLYAGGNDVYLAMKSVAWPTAEGSVIESALKTYSTNRHRSAPSYSADVSYVFTVAGQAHTGNAIHFSEYSGGRSYAQELVDRYPKGKSVKVYYCASNPTVCILEPGYMRIHWFKPLAGLAFIAFGSLMGILFPRLARKKGVKE